MKPSLINQSMTRRKALWLMSGLVSASLAGYRLVWPQLKNLLGFKGSSELTSSEWNSIALLVDQILPKTSTAPSGSEAGVLHYMSRALNGDLPGWTPSPDSVERGTNKSYSRGYKHFAAHYKKGVVRLDTLSRNRYGSSFESISNEERAKIVALFAEGAKADVGYNVKGAPSAQNATDNALFELIRRHSLEGYFSDPVNGGNKNYIAWESIKHTCHMNYPKKNGCP